MPEQKDRKKHFKLTIVSIASLALMLCGAGFYILFILYKAVMAWPD
jgi:hypothetical protein